MCLYFKTNSSFRCLFLFIGNVFRDRSLDVTMYYNFVNVNQSKKSGIKNVNPVHESS